MLTKTIVKIKTYNLRESEAVTINIGLEYLELFYLKLYTHGLSDLEISKFLEIDQKRIYYLRDRIRCKFNSKNWLEIVLKAFELQYLKKLDFVNSKIKGITLKNANLICKDINKGYSLGVKQTILDYYFLCEKLLCDDYNKKSVKKKLDKQELKYLKFKYEFFLKNELSEEMKTELTDNYFFKTKIFKKFNVNNWYNAFKKALEAKLIEKPYFQNFIIEKESQICAQKISIIMSDNTLNFKEKKLSIYIRLLEFQKTIELTNVLY